MRRRAPRAVLAVVLLAGAIAVGSSVMRGTDRGDPTPSSGPTGPSAVSTPGSAGADPSDAGPSDAGPSDDGPSRVDPTKPQSGPAIAKAGAPVDAEPLAPASLDDWVDFGNGLVAMVTRVERVNVEAHQPGETAGPAAVVRLRLRNRTSEPVDLAALAVNAEDVDGVPLVPNFSKPTKALSGVLEPGASRAGRYVFRHDGDLDALTIHVHHDTTPHFIVIRT